jgi:hypothetical protein
MPVESAPKLRISPRLTKFCEWSASFTGLAGAALVASKSDWAGYGFLAFLASNIAWIAYSVRTKTWSLLVMQLGFTATSLLGIKNWLLQ